MKCRLCEFHFRITKDTEHDADFKQGCVASDGPRGQEVFAFHLGSPHPSLHHRKEQLSRALWDRCFWV